VEGLTDHTDLIEDAVKADLVVHTYNPSTLEVKARASEV
jgi:hypothetical protein